MQPTDEVVPIEQRTAEHVIEVQKAGYVPYGAARQMWLCKDQEILIDGPAGTGKSRAVLEKANIVAMKYPGARILLTRQTRASMTQSVLVTFEEKVLAPKSPVKQGPKRQHRSSYVYPNGSEVVVGGLDNADRIMSTEYDLICVFEATETDEESWEKLCTRLRNYRVPYQQAIADCNPAGPTHWLKKRADKGSMTRFPSTHVDNPAVTKEYLKRLEKLTGHRRARLLEGKWIAAEGLVYKEHANCIVPPLDMENFSDSGYELLGLYGGVDFGWNDPFAALGAFLLLDKETEEDILYIYYERYMRETHIRDHAGKLARVFPKGMGTWFADPSRPESIRDLRRAGLSVKKGKNDIMTGIDAVYSRMTTGRLWVADTCIALISEFGSYSYPEGKETEKPEDEFNHACDALRYLVMGIDWRYIAK